MRFIRPSQPAVVNQQTPQLVTMDAYPSWDVAPTYRVQLTPNASYYSDVDLFEQDDGIHAACSDVNYGFLHQAGRLY